MKINLTVSNEHHVQLVSSVVDNMRESAFNDVTLVCSDGHLKVNGLLLALLLPAPYRNLHLDEGALLLLPQHKVQEVWAMVELEGQKRGPKQEVWQNQEKIKELNIEHDLNEVKPSSDILNITRTKYPDDDIENEQDLKELKSDTDIIISSHVLPQNEHIEPTRESEKLLYDMEDSSEDDSDQEEVEEDRRSSMQFIPAKEEHMPAEELAKVRARYIEGNVRSTIWLIVNEQFICHKNNKETKRGSVVWTCSGRYNFGCTAKALTHRVPRGTNQLETGGPVKLVYTWRSQLHTCNLDYSHIFIRDLKNRIKQCWLENPTLKYKTLFPENKAFLISRIPSKDLRKKLRKECKMEAYKTWFYTMVRAEGTIGPCKKILL